MQSADRLAVADVPADRGAEWSPRRQWTAATPLEEAMAAPLAPLSEAVKVYGNHDRWVVECPDCAGAQFACRTDRRFMCSECANVSIEGMWRPVVWPLDAGELEAELGKRAPKHRNWVPGETPADLKAERLANDPKLADLRPPMRASEWEGHTHRWPKVRNGPLVSCDECGLTLPAATLDEDGV